MMIVAQNLSTGHNSKNALRWSGERSGISTERSQGGRVERATDNPLFARSLDRMQGAVPMSPNNDAAGLRARLLTIAEVCAEFGVPLPMRAKLAKAIGASQRQIDRYMERLLADGVVARRTHKNAGRIAA